MNKYQLHEKQEFSCMRDLVERAAEWYGTDTAYSYRVKPHDKEIVKKNFTEMRDDVRAITSELISRGYAGKHCAVIGKCSYSWIRLYFAIQAAGAVIVPLDREWLAADLAETVTRADVEYLFIDEDMKEKEAAIVATGSVKETVYLGGSEGETVETLVELGKVKFDTDPDAYFNAPTDNRAMSIMVFTSGTTGKGKGVMLCQDAVLSDLSSVIPYIDFGKRTVCVLPPHHTFGSSVMFVGHMMIGTEMYLSAGLRYVAKELKEQKPEHLVLVPLYLETFYRKMQAAIKDQKKEKSVAFMMGLSNFLLKFGIDIRKKWSKSLREAMGGKIKMVISGGAPINADIIKFFNGIGIGTLNGYGITECAPIIAVNYSKNIVHGTVGNVLDIDDVKLADQNEDGEGEICVKGPNVMLGYFKDENATRAAFDEDGYFKTGDYGKFTKRGTLAITGRKKNLIILSNGKNVYPEEIENELVAVPGVIDVIVYEGQSKRGIEHNSIVAEVYPDKEFMEKNGITDVKKYLQTFVDDYNRGAVPYKKIGVLRVRDEEFPKNTLRKILRFKLDMTID